MVYYAGKPDRKIALELLWNNYRNVWQREENLLSFRDQVVYSQQICQTDAGKPIRKGDRTWKHRLASPGTKSAELSDEHV